MVDRRPIGELVDSAEVWLIGDRFVVAGRLVEPDGTTDAGVETFRGYPILWADEAFELFLGRDSVVARQVAEVRCMMPGEVDLSRAARRRIFGSDTTPRLRSEIDRLWRGWDAETREVYVRRQTWALRRIAGDREPTFGQRLLAANYACSRTLGEPVL